MRVRAWLAMSLIWCAPACDPGHMPPPAGYDAGDNSYCQAGGGENVPKPAFDDSGYPQGSYSETFSWTPSGLSCDRHCPTPAVTCGNGWRVYPRVPPTPTGDDATGAEPGTAGPPYDDDATGQLPGVPSYDYSTLGCEPYPVPPTTHYFGTALDSTGNPIIDVNTGAPLYYDDCDDLYWDHPDYDLFVTNDGVNEDEVDGAEDLSTLSDPDAIDPLSPLGLAMGRSHVVRDSNESGAAMPEDGDTFFTPFGLVKSMWRMLVQMDPKNVAAPNSTPTGQTQSIAELLDPKGARATDYDDGWGNDVTDYYSVELTMPACKPRWPEVATPEKMLKMMRDDPNWLTYWRTGTTPGQPAWWGDWSKNGGWDSNFSTWVIWQKSKGPRAAGDLCFLDLKLFENPYIGYWLTDVQDPPAQPPKTQYVCVTTVDPNGKVPLKGAWKHPVRGTRCWGVTRMKRGTMNADGSNPFNQTMPGADGEVVVFFTAGIDSHRRWGSKVAGGPMQSATWWSLMYDVGKVNLQNGGKSGARVHIKKTQRVRLNAFKKRLPLNPDHIWVPTVFNGVERLGGRANFTYKGDNAPYNSL
jgi:hypothetical protein